MATGTQKKASTTHRRRARARGLVRLEVQAPRGDAGLIKALARTLRDDTECARALRVSLSKVLTGDDVRTAFDVFGSDLPDEAFEGVFDQPRSEAWREVEL